MHIDRKALVGLDKIREEGHKRIKVGAHLSAGLAEVGPRLSVLIISLSLSYWLAVSNSDPLDCFLDHISWSDSDIAIHS